MKSNSNGGTLAIKLQILDTPMGKQITSYPKGLIVVERPYDKKENQAINSKFWITDLDNYSLKDLERDQRQNNKVVRISGEKLEKVLTDLMNEGKELTELGEDNHE